MNLPFHRGHPSTCRTRPWCPCWRDPKRRPRTPDGWTSCDPCKSPAETIKVDGENRLANNNSRCNCENIFIIILLYYNTIIFTSLHHIQSIAQSKFRRLVSIRKVFSDFTFVSSCVVDHNLNLIWKKRVDGGGECPIDRHDWENWETIWCLAFKNHTRSDFVNMVMRQSSLLTWEQADTIKTLHSDRSPSQSLFNGTWRPAAAVVIQSQENGNIFLCDSYESIAFKFRCNGRFRTGEWVTNVNVFNDQKNKINGYLIGFIGCMNCDFFSRHFGILVFK